MKTHILLDTEHCRVIRRAIVRGNLALHQALGKFSWTERWTITHVPSGSMFAIFGTAHYARKAMRALDALGDWSVLDRHDGMKLPYHSAAQKAVSQLRAAELGEVSR